MSKLRFEPATRHDIKARLALVGGSGSGKTYSALGIARGLAGPGGRVAVIDTENQSARKYSDRFEFDVLELDHFAPRTYVEAIRAAERAGYDVLVVDSLSHAWIGRGGALEQVDEAARRSRSGNSFTAWRDVTPRHNALVDALVRCRCHLIATLRVKTKYVIERDARGRSVPRKVGLAPVQRDGIDYEFDVVGELDANHKMHVTKSRCIEIADQTFERPDAAFGERLRSWLRGEDVRVAASGDQQPTAEHTLEERVRAAGRECARALCDAGYDADTARARLWELAGSLAERDGVERRHPRHLRAASRAILGQIASPIADATETLEADTGDDGGKRAA